MPVAVAEDIPVVEGIPVEEDNQVLVVGIPEEAEEDTAEKAAVDIRMDHKFSVAVWLWPR